MELEQFKDLWPRDVTGSPKKEEYVLSLLGKRSNSPIAKMKRNLFWELIAVVVFYSLGIAYYFVAYQGRMSEVAWLMLAIGIVFVFYYILKNRLLNQMQCVSCHVRSNLERQVETLEKYVRFYLVSGNILFPLMLTVVGVVGIYLYPERTNAGRSFSESPALKALAVYYTVVSIIASIGVFFLNKWYVNRLYGRHIRRLKEIVNEMESESED